MDIAIIGMAGLFPKAADVSAFWANILESVDATDDPLPEWGADLFHDPASDDLGRLYTRRGGFLKELSRFDPRTFGIMPVSVAGGEPDQFHALDLAGRALEDAGLREGDYQPETTGIILGHGIHAHRANTNGIQHGLVLDQTVGLLASLFPELSRDRQQQLRTVLRNRLPALNVDSVPGLVPNMMTGRIANRFNLMGPNYIIDAACASSLIAVDAAMTELRQGRADVMLAGGVNTTTSPLVYMVFCELGALSRSSRVQPFAAGADGTLLGEGGGVVVLKRLPDAVRDSNRVYAVLKAVGQASDGRAKGLMAPRLEGEALAISRAYRQAGFSPERIGLLEAHGTGIPLGDQTEIHALRQVMGARRGRLPEVALGSIKSMIGHCIPAAGIASLIKVTLALHHRILPPTQCAEPNPRLGLEQTPFYLNTETRPWIHSGPALRCAGINAFGFGGINTHAILEESPLPETDSLAAFLPQGRRGQAALLVFEQPDRPALLQQLAAVRQRLPAEPDLHPGELAAQLWRERGQGVQRLAVIATDSVELTQKLDWLLPKLAEENRHRLQTRNGIFFCDQPPGGAVALLFPGENSQYPNMLRSLAVEFPTVRRWFDFLDRLFGAERELKPSQAIFPPPSGLSAEDRTWLESRLRDMELGSESVFVADQALFALLGEFGVGADALLGHSTGENSAIIASGAMLADPAKLGRYILEMNRIYRELEAAGVMPDGRLLSVGATTLDQVQAVLDADPRLFLTMDNCFNQFILFGPEAAIEQAHETFKSSGAFCALLALDRGYHTPLMAPMAAAFRELFASVELRAPSVPLYSCVTAAPFPDAPETFRDTAADQYQRPVRFRESIQRLYADGVRVFIEVGPSSHLSAFVRDVLHDQPHLAVAMNNRNRDDCAQLGQALAALFVHGLPLQLNRLYQGRARKSLHTPYLPTDLVLLRIDSAEAQEIRDWLTLAESPPLPDAPPVVPQPPAALGRSATLAEHFVLMQEFLSQQDRVMNTWLHRRQNR